jgi:hypothetical protein
MSRRCAAPRLVAAAERASRYLALKRRFRATAAVGLENFLPTGVYVLAVAQVLLVQLVFEPTVDT